eukprot:TRINITY_DN13269_c0_g1_i1.p1 TRINITY_DN13269_c0_g1~~TRINITY_DN13269_c0_g1_i1.p1  ORF type:complete len:289 (+),score=110.09 TRINITY_DN13269_c0_g1_i1:81-869(+)
MVARAAACLALASAASAANIVVAGDSWADYMGIPNREFPRVFEANGDSRTILNIARGGTTCANWVAQDRLQQLLEAVRGSDVQHLWLTCGGNDAQFNLIGCSPQAECIADIIEKAKKDIGHILREVKRVNPKVRVVAFGYDLMGLGSIIGQLLARTVLPDCKGDAFCTNSNFLQLQVVVDELAAQHDNFDSVNLLGSLQAWRGVEGAAVGQPVLSQFSPSDTFDASSIHPTADGYYQLFSNFYAAYWSKNRLAAAPNATRVH